MADVAAEIRAVRRAIVQVDVEEDPDGVTCTVMLLLKSGQRVRIKGVAIQDQQKMAPSDTVPISPASMASPRDPPITSPPAPDTSGFTYSPRPPAKHSPPTPVMPFLPLHTRGYIANMAIPPSALTLIHTRPTYDGSETARSELSTRCSSPSMYPPSARLDSSRPPTRQHTSRPASRASSISSRPAPAREPFVVRSVRPAGEAHAPPAWRSAPVRSVPPPPEARRHISVLQALVLAHTGDEPQEPEPTLVAMPPSRRPRRRRGTRFAAVLDSVSSSSDRGASGGGGGGYGLDSGMGSPISFALSPDEDRDG